MNTKNQLAKWEAVDNGWKLLLWLSMVSSVTLSLLMLVGCIGCSPQSERPGVAWPPTVEFSQANVNGYVDLRINGTTERVMLDATAKGGESANGAELIGWGVAGELSGTVNGNLQSVRVQSTNQLNGENWQHCFDAGLAMEFAEFGTMEASGIPPGFSVECGFPTIVVKIPFLGWDFSFSKRPDLGTSVGDSEPDTSDTATDSGGGSVSPVDAENE